MEVVFSEVELPLYGVLRSSPRIKKAGPEGPGWPHPVCSVFRSTLLPSGYNPEPLGVLPTLALYPADQILQVSAMAGELGPETVTPSGRPGFLAVSSYPIEAPYPHAGRPEAAILGPEGDLIHRSAWKMNSAKSAPPSNSSSTLRAPNN